MWRPPVDAARVSSSTSLIRPARLQPHSYHHSATRCPTPECQWQAGYSFGRQAAVVGHSALAECCQLLEMGGVLP